jgi:hypothetical protein
MRLVRSISGLDFSVFIFLTYATSARRIVMMCQKLKICFIAKQIELEHFTRINFVPGSSILDTVIISKNYIILEKQLSTPIVIVLRK